MTAAILIVDDEKAIHESYRHCLHHEPGDTSELDALEALLFGEDEEADSPPAHRSPTFEIEHAYQGEQAIELLETRMRHGGSYRLAFVDVRMPPGWDGIETSRRLRELDPGLAIVICTAYCDMSWDHIRAAIPGPDNLFLLRKPFNPEQIRALAMQFAT